MKLFFLFLFTTLAFAQTSPFPTSLDSNATLGVSVDNVTSNLTSVMLVGDTTAQVANATKIPQWSLVTLGTELMQVCLKSGNTLTFGTPTVCPSIAGRGLSGTTVAPHNNGVIMYLLTNGYYQQATASAIIAVQGAMPAMVSASGPTLNAAYASLPATGGSVNIAAALAFGSATTLTYTPGKAVALDGLGHTITCTNTSGACLTFTPTAIGGTPTQVSIRNLTFVYAGASSNVQGLSIANLSDSLLLENVSIVSFSTSGSTCLKLTNAENVTGINVRCNASTNGFLATAFSTNSHFYGSRFELLTGVPIRIEQQSSGITFDGMLMQSTTGAHGVEIDSTSGGNINSIAFNHCWIENVGDTTGATRLFSLNASASHAIKGFAVNGCVTNADTQGALGTVFYYDGDGSALTVNPGMHLETPTSYSVYAAGAFSFPSFGTGENLPFSDAGINLNGKGGFHLFPQTGAHHYWLWAGDSAQQGDGNNFSISDLTAATKPLHYTAASQTWNFLGPIVAGGAISGASLATTTDVLPGRDMIASRFFGSTNSVHTWACLAEFAQTQADLNCKYDTVTKFHWDNTGRFGVNTAGALTTMFTVVGLPSFANNAAALAGALTVGAFYINGDVVQVVH